MPAQSFPARPSAPAANAGATHHRSFAALAEQPGEKSAPLGLVLHCRAEGVSELLYRAAAFGQVSFEPVHDGGLDRRREPQPAPGLIQWKRGLGEKLLKQL